MPDLIFLSTINVSELILIKVSLILHKYCSAPMTLETLNVCSKVSGQKARSPFIVPGVLKLNVDFPAITLI